MRHFALVCVLALSTTLAAPTAFAKEAKPDGPKIYVQAESGFTTALTAAIVKKNVPVTIVEDKTGADYVLQSASVDSKDESGAGKVARCLFLDCVGMNGFSEVSVKLVRTRDSSVVWAYQVRKANSGPVGVQSLSEAIAKHLKNDYLNKLK
jgi:hypothetical protein